MQIILSTYKKEKKTTVKLFSFFKFIKQYYKLVIKFKSKSRFFYSIIFTLCVL